MNQKKNFLINHLILIIYSQISIKYCLFNELQRLVRIAHGIGEKYRQNSRPNDEFYAICQRFVRITEITMKMVIAGYIGCMAGTLIFGLCDALLSDERQPFVYCYLPKIRDYSNNFYYLLITIYNSCILSLAAIAIAPCDVFFAIIIANALMIPAMIQQQMNELSADLRKTRGADTGDIQRRLIRYIKMHHEYNE